MAAIIQRRSQDDRAEEKAMRLLRFDRQADAALRTIGFNIEENGDVAKITGHMTISAVRSSDSDSLLLEIELPNGHLLDCKTSCAVLMEADDD
jgi:hypothetical protein